MSRLSILPMRAARWSATHPWRAITAWLALVVVAVGLALAVPVTQTTDADYRIGESGRAHAIATAAGLARPPVENVLITARDGTLDAKAAASAASRVTHALANVPGVRAIDPPVPSPDRSALLVTVELAKGTTDVTPLQRITAATARDFPGLRIGEAGDASINAEINDRVARDLHSAEFISLPVTLVLMLLAFGALIAAGVPVLLAGTSVAATMGLAAPISHLVHAEPSVNSVIVLVGMAVGIDYSLFYLKREREERAKGATTLDAVTIAAQTSGHAILVSGGAVIAAMSGLYAVGFATFDSLATGAIVVVAIAVAGSITVLPALLATLGRFVDRPRIPLLWRLNRRIGQGGISRRLLAPVQRHPAAALVGSLAVTIALAFPALGMTVGRASFATLPQDLPTVATASRIADRFPSQGTTATVVVKAPAADAARVRAALLGLSAQAEHAAYARGMGVDPITVSADRTVTTLDLAIPYPERDPRVGEAITAIRTGLAQRALDGLPAEYAVGGDAAWSHDILARERGRMPIVLGAVLALTMVMMLGAFRSVPLALVSTGCNLLSVGVAFGVLRLIFQDGRLEPLLDFTSPGYIIEWIPLFVLAILVGLSMDYHVFVLSRVKEYAAQGLPMRVAVRRGVGDTAGVVTSAAAVMVSVFTIFITLSMLEMKMMGVALAVAILIDATVIRLVLLPAALILLGDRAWWPSRPGRVRRRVAGTRPGRPVPAPSQTEPTRVGRRQHPSVSR
ncbi:MAG: MMPL family transporter [Dermatophilaceae bacterium]